MTTPSKQEKLWKNIDWKTKEEKEAFYNKYFKRSEFVNREVDARVDTFKEELLAFMDDECIFEGKNKRKPNLADIKSHLTDKG